MSSNFIVATLDLNHYNLLRMKKILTDKIINSAIFTLSGSMLYAGLLVFFYLTKISPQDFITNFYKLTNMNIFMLSSFKGINPMVIVYTVFFAVLLLSFLLGGLFKRKLTLKRTHIVKVCLLSFFMLFSMFQFSLTLMREKTIIDTYKDKTVKEKKELLFGLPYIFASLCKDLLPGRHASEFITDLKPKTRSRDLAISERIQYHLYPVDISDISDEKKDSLVIFSQKDPKISGSLLKKYPDLHVFGNYFGVALKKRNK